jgi:hypothetical protein
MMHPKIEDEEIIERYVRNQLPPADRQAFEEHYFTCDACFEKLQAMERFVAGIREAARDGKLAKGVPAKAFAWGALGWWVPTFGATLAAAFLFAMGAGWMYITRVTGMREQLSESAARLRGEQQARTLLEEQLQGNMQAEGNVPVVILQATRESQASPTEAVLPAGATRLVVWIDAGFGKHRSFRLELLGGSDKPIETLAHLTRNSYGALAVSLPTERLQPGDYRIKLSAEEPGSESLVAEYGLRLHRP